MRRLRALILLFVAALTIPLGYFVWRTWKGLEREERAELAYFADTLFERMETDLADFVRREEARSVEEYNVGPMDTVSASAGEGLAMPPLALPPEEPFVLGYLQNNPDGSFQSPAAWPEDTVTDAPDLTAALDEANEILNRKRSQAVETPAPSAPVLASVKSKKVEVEKQAPSPADRYFNVEDYRKPKDHLGQDTSRTQQITQDQARIITRDAGRAAQTARREEPEESGAYESAQAEGLNTNAVTPQEKKMELEEDDDQEEDDGGEPKLFRVEVAPMQSIFLDDDRVFIYRRILIDHQVYRQGAVVKVRDLLDHLTKKYFQDQPMAAFTRLTLSARDRGREAARREAGAIALQPVFTLERDFPRPFGFITARLTSDAAPGSPARGTLLIMSAALLGVMLAGLFAIYRSARLQVELSERRSGFVSSVTHELKTPLTNIRMYVEMLEEGLARDPDREQEYFRVIGSETSRLGRLINNVLEFSKLESKQKRFDIRERDFAWVMNEAATVMGEKVRQEGFKLKTEATGDGIFPHDREVMVQVLVNLIENSLKFGRSSEEKEIAIRLRRDGDRMVVGVSDTGPGIPEHALKKVFDDFYRVDNSLTQTTGGTGIGLALVRKLVEAMGGKVSARNNHGPGCTIEINLPAG